MYQRIGWTALRLLVIWTIIYLLVACTETDVVLPRTGTPVSPTPASVSGATDTHGDGLSDEEEATPGTSPLIAETRQKAT